MEQKIRKTKIFINYRRADSQTAVEALRAHLLRYYPEDYIMVDVYELLAGQNFVRTLYERVSECDVFLAIIGPNWLTIEDDNSPIRRIDKENDWVRTEIRIALEQGKLVIPVLLDDTVMPSEDNLPKDIRALASLQAFRLPRTIGAVMQRFVDEIELSWATHHRLYGPPLDTIPPPQGPLPTPKPFSLENKKSLIYWFIGAAVVIGMFSFIFKSAAAVPIQTETPAPTLVEIPTETSTATPSPVPTKPVIATKYQASVPDGLVPTQLEGGDNHICVSWYQGIFSVPLSGFGWDYFNNADYPYTMALDCDMNTLTCSELYAVVDPNSNSLPQAWLVIPEQTETSCTVVEEPTQGYWVEIILSD